MAFGAFLAKMGSEAAARLAAPYYPLLFIVVLTAVAIPLGHYMTSVFDGTSVVVRKIGRPVEHVRDRRVRRTKALLRVEK